MSFFVSPRLKFLNNLKNSRANPKQVIEIFIRNNHLYSLIFLIHILINNHLKNMCKWLKCI